jgi:hypothetical protein
MQKIFSESDEQLALLIEPIVANVIQNYQIVENLKNTQRKEALLLEACKAISSELDVG